MPNATQLPKITEVKLFQWSNVTNPDPRVKAASATATTLIFTAPPKDKNGTIITGGFLGGFRTSDSKIELFWVPEGGMSADGLTATGVVRGIAPDGIDYETGAASRALQITEESPVYCAIPAVMQSIFINALQGIGDMATGGIQLVIGDQTVNTVAIKRIDTNGDVQNWFDYDGSKTRYSNDGSSMNSIDAALAGQLVVVSGADITAGNLSGKVLAGDGVDATINNPGGAETYTLSVDVTDIIDTSFGLEEDSNNIRIKLATDPGLEFDGVNGIRVKAGSGITRDTSGISLDRRTTQTRMAYESISQHEAVCELPLEWKWREQFDDSNFINLGDVNGNRRYARKFTAAKTQTLSGDRFLRLQKSGSATQTITYSIQADSSGDPSGTALDSATLDASTLTTSPTTETFNLTTGVSLVKGTEYWEVIEVDATDGANFVQVQIASAWDEYFPTEERKTFDLDAGTWGGSVTNAPFWCWGDSNLGFVYLKTDASYASKTFTFKGFASAAGTKGNDLAIYDDVGLNVTGATLADAEEYWLSTTAGQVTTTAPSYDLALATTPDFVNVYKVAETIVDTTGSLAPRVNKGPKRLVGHFQDNTSTLTEYQVPTFFKNPQIRIDVRADGGGFGGVGFADGTSTSRKVSMYGSSSGGDVHHNSIGLDENGTPPYLDVTNISDIGLTLEYDGDGSTSYGFLIEITQK